MILILTQCFPTRIGGIESLISNLALSLSNREKIIVLADQYDVINEALFPTVVQLPSEPFSIVLMCNTPAAE